VSTLADRGRARAPSVFARVAPLVPLPLPLYYRPPSISSEGSKSTYTRCAYKLWSLHRLTHLLSEPNALSFSLPMSAYQRQQRFARVH